MIRRNNDGKIEKGMLTVKELAEYMNVSKDTIYKMVNENKISYLPVQSEIRFPISHIEGYIEKHIVKASA